MKKRIGSVILTLAVTCLCVVALGGEARAAEHNHTDWTAWTATDKLPNTSGSYYLTENVTLSSTWSVPTGTTNLCLNGKSITLTADAGSVIKIDSGATLNLYDEGTDTHQINGSTINGGLITGGKGTHATSYYGGGVYIDGSSNSNHATLHMYGGTIAGNQATYGGGVYLGSTKAIFTMYGGTISGNTTNYGGKGAGVYFDSGTMTVSGTAKIKDNTDGATKSNSNVYLYSPNNTTLNIGSDGLTSGAEIWVTTYSQPGNPYVANPLPITSGASTAQYENYFKSDNTRYEIEAMSDGKVGLASKCTITFDANGGEGTMTSQKIYTGEETALNANSYTRTGYTFVRWNTKEDGSGTSYADGAAVTLYGATTTLYAQWSATPATAPAITIPTETITAPYNGESSNITVEVDLASGYTITGYTWYRATKSNLSDKQSFQTWTGSTTGKTFSCTHGSGLSAGTYYYCCEITVQRDDNKKTATTTSSVITATVTKATPTYTAPTGLTATTGQTLADVTLPSVSGGVWKWDEPSTSVGNETGTHSFPATYTPSDTINYKTATANLSVNVVAPHVHDDVAGVTFMPWNDANSLPATAGSYYLTKNVTLSATWTVPAGVTNLCLDEKSIKQSSGAAVVTIGSGATLNLYDKTGDNGTITHNGGTGRGVEVRYGTFNMYGGKITGNRINGGNGGGGAYVYAGTFNMYGGEISGNTANGLGSTGTGGGVSLLSGKFCMDGGKITGNTATGNSSQWSNGKGEGGGVYIVGSNSEFTMTGGEITGNTALSNGGGVYVKSGRFKISGNPNISENTKSGKASNLYIYNPDGKLVIDGKLDNAVNIGVYASSYSAPFTSGWTEKMGNAVPADYFTSERDGYQIYLVGEEARLTFQRTLTFNANNGSEGTAVQTVLGGLPFTFPANEFTLPDGKSFKAWQMNSKEYQPGAVETFSNNTNAAFTVTALWGYAVTFSTGDGSTAVPVAVTDDGKVTKPADPTRSGYTFDGWYKDADLTEAWDFDNGAVTEETTLYAKWTPVNYTVTFDSDGGSDVASQTVASGDTATQPATPTKSGYTFNKWQLGEADYDFSTPVTGNVTLKAVWTANPTPPPPDPPALPSSDYDYTVTFDSDGGSDVASQTVASGDTATQPATPTKSGYTFNKWQLDEADYDFSTPVTGNVTLKAVWTANPTPPPPDPPALPSSDYDYTPPTPSTATVTVPVSGDESTVNVTVRVTSGGEATLTSANVSAALDGNDFTGTVAIDLGGLTQEVSSVTIPAAIVADIAGAVASADNATDSLTVKLTDGSVTFDATAVESITAQSGGNDLKLNLDGVETNTMNGAQQSAVARLEVAGVLDVYMTSNNVRISDFGGGSAEVRIPFTAPEGRTENEYGVWYVAEDGAMTNQRARYDAEDACFVFTVTHFSNYVIAYGGCPQDETCPIAAYADADPAAWYHDGAHWAIERGVMDGVGDGLFAPDGDTSRAMVAVMLWRLEGKPTVNTALTFVDVQAGTWYAEGVRWAASVGVITGWEDAATGRPVFAPDTAVTREQLATMLWRYAKYKGADVSVGEDTNILSYGDVFDVSEWAISAMQWAVGSGAVGGRTDTTLNPKDNATRAEIATMMQRFCEKIVK